MSDNPPIDHFIGRVLHLYYNECWEENQIAEHFNVSKVIIVRVLDQYGKANGKVPRKETPIVKEKKEKEIKTTTKIEELNEIIRTEKEKLTKNDLNDLLIDIALFEKGHEPEEPKE